MGYGIQVVDKVFQTFESGAGAGSNHRFVTRLNEPSLGASFLVLPVIEVMKLQ